MKAPNELSPQQARRVRVALWFSIAVGLGIFSLAAWRNVAANGAALGGILLMIGLNGFLALRVAQLERRTAVYERELKRLGGGDELEGGRPPSSV